MLQLVETVGQGHDWNTLVYSNSNYPGQVHFYWVLPLPCPLSLHKTYQKGDHVRIHMRVCPLDSQVPESLCQICMFLVTL